MTQARMSDSDQASLQHDALSDLMSASRMPRNSSTASLHSVGGNDIWNAPSQAEMQALSHQRADEVCSWMLAEVCGLSCKWRAAPHVSLSRRPLDRSVSASL